MENSILDALKIAVDGTTTELYERRRSVILMNERRQDILHYLCSHPCTHLRKIARDLKLGNRNLQFHLSKLIKGNFVSMKKIRNRVVYFPSGMLSPENVELRAFMNGINEAEAFFLILEKPGISQGEICSKLKIDRQKLRKVIRRMEKHSVVTTIKDGRFCRHYASEHLQKIVAQQKRQSRAFRQMLIRNMKSDGLSPQIVRATEREIHVKLSSGKKTRILFLSINPFADIQTV